MTENNGDVNWINNAGLKITGPVIGAAVGSFVAGPWGAVGGALLEIVITESLTEFANRKLSQSEKERVDAVVIFAKYAILDKLKKGLNPRDDGFFDKRGTKRSFADEILEGVLEKSRNEYQEMKIRLLGNFYANLAFSPEISATEANHLLKIADYLTYRQMCLLELFYSKHEIENLHLNKNDFYDIEDVEQVATVNHQTISLYQEILEMFTQGLLIRLSEDGEGTIQSLSRWNEIAPDSMVLTPLGERLAVLLDLDYKKNEDFDAVVSQLIE